MVETKNNISYKYLPGSNRK